MQLLIQPTGQVYQARSPSYTLLGNGLRGRGDRNRAWFLSQPFLESLFVDFTNYQRGIRWQLSTEIVGHAPTHDTDANEAITAWADSTRPSRIQGRTRNWVHCARCGVPLCSVRDRDVVRGPVSMFCSLTAADTIITTRGDGWLGEHIEYNLGKGDMSVWRPELPHRHEDMVRRGWGLSLPSQ